jgi:hypothetical protein
MIKEVQDLLEALDTKARNFDKAKYGLPPKGAFQTIVYNWVYQNRIKGNPAKEKL